MRTNFVGHLGCVIAFSAVATAWAGGGPSAQELNDPFPQSSNNFGSSVAAVGSDMVIVGGAGADSKLLDVGEAFLFDIDGTLLQSYFAPQFIEDEGFGWHVCGVGDSAVLISSGPFASGLPGAVYLFDLDGNELDSFSSPSASADDGFGVCAVVGTDTAVIGAAHDDADGLNSGRAFVFDLSGGEGGGPTIIANPNLSIGSFGRAVAALPGNRVAIAAQENLKLENETAVYVFQLPGGDLVQTISDPSPEIHDLAAYGADQLLIGGFSDPVHLYDVATGNIDLTIPDPGKGDTGFGFRVAALGNGTIAIAAPLADPGFAGAVYLYDPSGTQLDELTDPGSPEPVDSFGSGGLAPIGCNQLAVGSPEADEFKVASDAGEVWVFSDLAGGNCSNNYVEVHLDRVDDFEQVEVAFDMEIIVAIPDQQGVVDVDVLTGGEQFIAMENLGGGQWSGTATYFSLDDLITSLDGLWTIETSGPKEGGGAFSGSEFPLNLSGVIDGDFFPTPTVTNPVDGAVNVPITANFSWTDPTGVKDTADVLFVVSEPQNGSAGHQENDSLNGTLSVTATTWNPPQDLLPGANRFEVGYVSLSDGTLAGDINVNFGNIVWGNSPLLPKGLPDGLPLVTFGSSTAIGFGAGTGGIGVLPPNITNAAGIPEHESTGDYDGDGDTDVVVTIPDLDPANEGVIQVFLNQGTDQFGEWLGFEAQPTIPVGREPTWVTTGNFNFDSFPDICVTNAGDDNVSIFINDGSGNGTFLPEVNVTTGDGPSSCTTAHFNEQVDSFLDIAVTNENDADLVILFNDGFGNFTLGGASTSVVVPLGVRSFAMTSGDFDGNKCPDAVGSGDAVGFGPAAGQVFVVLGNGLGGFGPPILLNVGADPRDISVGDVNGDLLNDIFVANRGDGTIMVLVSQGGGAFDPPITIPVAGMPRSIDAVNLDADSDPDIAVVAEGTSTVQVFVNRTNESPGFGSGPVVIDPAVQFPVGGSPNFVVHTDLDEDGISDLCMVNQDPSGPEAGSLSALIIDLFPEEDADCPADLNGDDFVNIIDFIMLLELWGPCDKPCDADIDGDGFVGIADLLILLQTYGPCPGDGCPWDVSGDGEVNVVDLLDVIEHLGDCDDPLDCPWDIDGDGVVGFFDLLQVLANFGPCPG